MSRRARLLIGLLCLCPALALQAAEGRTPIPFATPIATPIVIDTPGQYVLTRNLSATGAGPVFQINAAGVDLDLNGMTVTGDASSTVIEIGLDAEARIRNGAVSGGTVGINTDGADRVVIEQVTVTGTSDRGIYLFDVDQFAILDSIIVDAGSVGIAAEGGQNENTQGVIANNQLRRVSDGICVFGGGGVRVEGNSIREKLAGGPFNAGIVIDSVNAPLLLHNTIVDVDGGTGILMTSATFGATVEGNNVRNVTGGVGIRVIGADNLIRANVVSNAANEGLLIDGDRNQVERNILNGNGSWGLRFSSTADANVFRGNTARGNTGIGASCNASATADFCDDDFGVSANASQGDNWLPNTL